MGLLSKFVNFIRFGTASFTDYERRVLRAVEERLSTETGERFRKRINAVNLVQRIDGGREVNCFVIFKGRAILAEETRINSSSGEQILARFTVRGPLGTSNTGNVWLVDGNLFSIEFNDPTEHADPGSIEKIDVEMIATTS
jgi:hypothetical protein